MANERTVSRQTWWIEFGAWMSGQTNGPICLECADEIPDGGITGAMLCVECEEAEQKETA